MKHGGKRPGAGRPPGTGRKGDSRNATLAIRVRDDEREEVERKARAAGLKLSAYIRGKLLD